MQFAVTGIKDAVRTCNQKTNEYLLFFIRRCSSSPSPITANQFVVSAAFLDADALWMSLRVHLALATAAAKQTAARICRITGCPR